MLSTAGDPAAIERATTALSGGFNSASMAAAGMILTAIGIVVALVTTRRTRAVAGAAT